jgi:hypothetical protein
MARKTVRVSDISGAEIPDGREAVVRITFADRAGVQGSLMSPMRRQRSSVAGR